MHTFAVFSDVHANLPALEAVLADLDVRLTEGSVDAVFCLGDLVGYNVWPNEVVAVVRARGIPTVAGNYDEGVGLASDDCGCAYQTDEDRARGAQSIGFTNGAVTPETRRWLRGLPREVRVTLAPPRRPDGPPTRMLMVHGSPRKINEYLFEDRPEAGLTRMMEAAATDIMLFGHTHRPYHRRLARTDGSGFRHAVNTGSVGKPKDGDPRAGYVLLTVDPELPNSDEGACRVEVVRVPYDVARACAAIEASPLPDAFAQALRQAR